VRRSEASQVPRADSRIAAKAALLDYLVGEREQGRLHLGLQVDDPLKLGRLHNGKVVRFDPLQDAAGIDADLSKQGREIGSVAHQPADLDNPGCHRPPQPGTAPRQTARRVARLQSWQRPDRSRGQRALWPSAVVAKLPAR